MRYVRAKGLSGVTAMPMTTIASAHQTMCRLEHRCAPTYTSMKTGRLSTVAQSQCGKCAKSLASKKKAGPNSHTSHTSHTHGVMRPYQPRASSMAMHSVESGAALSFMRIISSPWYAADHGAHHMYGTNRRVRRM